MAEVRIESFGHSCFRITYNGKSAVLDPYENDSVPGLKLPENIEADCVYCSHGHGDHNAAHLIRTAEPESDGFAMTFITVPHDDAGGALRGMNRITFLHAGNCRIVHMGDIGRLPTQEEYQKLSGVEVMLIPVGGHYTIDAAQAAEIISKAKPKLSILMHFRKGNRGYGVIADINDVKKEFPSLKEFDETSVSFDENEVPEEIITLEPVQ